MARRHTNYGLPGESETLVSTEFDALDESKQGLNHKHFPREPKNGEVGEGQFVLALAGGQQRLYTKIDGRLYYSVLTAV